LCTFIEGLLADDQGDAIDMIGAVLSEVGVERSIGISIVECVQGVFGVAGGGG
jgi:hypothetical protein